MEAKMAQPTAAAANWSGRIATALLAATLVLLPAVGQAQDTDADADAGATAGATAGAPSAFRITAWRQVTWVAVQPVAPAPGLRSAAYGEATAPRFRLVLVRLTEVRTVTGSLAPPRPTDAGTGFIDLAPSVSRPTPGLGTASFRPGLVRRDDPRFAPRLRRTSARFDPARANGSFRVGVSWLDDVISGRD